MARRSKNINLVCKGTDGDDMFVITVPRAREDAITNMRESFVYGIVKPYCFARFDDGEFSKRFELSSEPVSLVAMNSPVDVTSFSRLLNTRALSTIALSTYARCKRIEPDMTVFHSNTFGPLFIAIPMEDSPEFISRFGGDFTIEPISSNCPPLSAFTAPSALAIPMPDIHQAVVSGGFGDSAKVAFRL